MSENTTILVLVPSWSISREVIISKGFFIKLEVALRTCSDCESCLRRMREITERVADLKQTINWENDGGGTFISIKLPEGKDPLRHLSETLGLEIVRTI